jgi:hypothetical protein
VTCEQVCASTFAIVVPTKFYNKFNWLDVVICK